MAYGQDLRQRVLRFYDSGQKTSEIARRLGVSPAYCRRTRQFRDQPPRINTGRPFKLDAAAGQSLAARVAIVPDATLEELQSWCGLELGVSISIGALWSTLKRMKLTLKKNR